MEEKKKKSTGLKVLVIILSLIVVGLITFICLDKLVFSKSNKEDKKEEVQEKEIEDKEITVVEISEMKHLSEVIFKDVDELEFEDLKNQEKLNMAIELVGKPIDEVKGQELIDAVHKYFGEDATLELEDIDCFEDHGGDGDELYLYSESKDRFVYNDKHPGHGGGGFTGLMTFFDSVKYNDDEYHFIIGMYYSNTACDDICPPHFKTNGKIYKTYEDFKAGGNYILDAAKDKSLYMYGSEYDDYYGNEYIYDWEKIYEKVRDDVKKYDFTFKKVNGSFVFVNYKAI